jgi:E1A/CREB-binding protein
MDKFTKVLIISFIQELEEKRKARMDTQQQQQQQQQQVRGGGQIIRPPGPGQGLMSPMGMPNSQQDNSMLRNTLQQPVGAQVNRPPMSCAQGGMPGNNSQGMPGGQMQQQPPGAGGGQSQLESLLKKNTHDLDPNDLKRAAEIRHKVPTVDSLASSNPNSMAGIGHTVMTQATTSQSQLMSTANMNTLQQQQHHMSMANNNNGGLGQMQNGPNNGMGGLNNTIKTEDNKMEVKTEIKNEPGMDPVKLEPMDPAATSTGGQNDVKMETKDIKAEIKEEPDAAGNGPTSSGGQVAKTEPVKSEAADSKPAPPAPPPIKIEKVQFSLEQLRDALLPPLEKMWAQEPESGPFRTPVDPNALGIPDYFEIIKTPMDMSSIRRKLETGVYKVLIIKLFFL